MQPLGYMAISAMMWLRIIWTIAEASALRWRRDTLSGVGLLRGQSLPTRRALLHERICIGIGFGVHPLAFGRALIPTFKPLLGFGAPRRVRIG
jgi:hypothetical protein